MEQARIIEGCRQNTKCAFPPSRPGSSSDSLSEQFNSDHKGLIIMNSIYPISREITCTFVSPANPISFANPACAPPHDLLDFRERGMNCQSIKGRAFGNSQTDVTSAEVRNDCIMIQLQSRHGSRRIYALR